VIVAKLVSISSPSWASSSVIGVAEKVSLKKNGQLEARREQDIRNFECFRNAYIYEVLGNYLPKSNIRKHQ
jgi:hypothetical protein